MAEQIIIKPYQHYWRKEFLNEKNKISSLLKEEIITIEHIGSTAVEGLGAKPLIDMMVGVTNLEITENWIENLAEIGYEYVPKETTNWRFFRKGKWRAGTHHLHVYIYNSEEWKNNLLFRDFLINNEWARKEYRELKEKLAATYPFDRVSYTNAKAPFICNILELAKKSINKV
ncbi:GrpB family protein [Bacillus hominis]|uniref:GrpB family protein n=1 Tax=Bacillus hominis TaxID=2817478 RepID=A0ABT7R7U2_9BACI|nr:GrpB family protein [Bacillus hominis]MDM5193871.1 GrpB family protein [Bacillus hominis]MDM5433573.1 GrpB family protein [Bacillus hominis]MDM5438997.1 GrpB family protein [Bacillus hominis]